MFFHFGSWVRGIKAPMSGKRRNSTYRHKDERCRHAVRLYLEALESRETPALTSFGTGAYIVDMGQFTQTVGNALKPYGLVYDLVTNFKVPVNWAINPNKTTFRLDPGNPVPVDFTATITTGTKSYSGGSFIIDAAFLTPQVIADINTWKAQGVVIDTLATPLTTEIYGQITSFPRAVLDAQNGKLAIPYYTNAGVPASSYQIGNPTDLDKCDDVYILPHADPATWPPEWKQALYDFVNSGGGLWAGCHSVAELENLIINGTTQLNFLSNGGLVPFGSHADGTPPYSYLPAAANDPIMQIMNRLDAATQNGSEQIYVPTTLDWRSTTTVAVFDPDHPNNPTDGTTPFNDAAVIAYGNAYGDPTKGLVMYEGGHSLSGTATANVAAQRAFFNFLLTQGIIHAPQPTVTIPTIVAGQTATLTATITGGSGTYSYQWVSANGGVFSQPAGTYTEGGPPITTQYLMTGANDVVRLLVTDTCGRQGFYSTQLVDAPPTIDLDANNSSGATGADYKGYFTGGAIVPAADPDTLITDNGTVIKSAAIKLTTRPDGAAETLLINESLAASFGINVASDGQGGFVLTGTATLAQYQQVIASLQYTDSLPFPNSTDRVITVTVNDGISNSNTATSRLSFLGGSVATVNKQLYLSDPGQGMDRVDPVATNDTTTSSVAVVPVVSPNSTGLAVWSNAANKNLESRPWNLTNYGTQATTTTDGGSYITMASAASAKRNEAIVVGVTSDQHVSGSIWNGSSWTPIAINIGGKTTQNLGKPSQKQWWGAAVAYETNSGRAMLVWNTGTTLNYSLWNGTSWTPAASIPGYTGTEPRQIRIASNPLAGSNEIVITVTDKNEVDRALVWNGTSWGNQIQLDNDTAHNFTDANVVYEQQSGRAMVVYASGTAGAVGYRIWDGSTWSSAATLSPPAGANNYAQWTVVAADPNSNRIVLGVETNGQDAWMNVWNGSAWGTSTLGVQDRVDNPNNLEIAVAFESKSGDALAVYQNNEATNTTELQYRTFSGGSWSAGTNFGTFGNKVSRSITLNSNPYSDQIMLMVNDDAKILRSDLWDGSTFTPPPPISPQPIQLETNTNTQDGQPFSLIWDRYLPGTVTTTTTFTQTTAMTSPFVMPTGGAVKVTTYIQLTSGTLPAAPKLSVRLGQGGSAILTIPAPPTVTPLGGGLFKLEWTGSIPNNVTVPTGGQISLTLLDFDSTYSFNVLYDSNTFPSQVQVATATGITVTSLGVYGAPYPGGSPLTTTPAGQPAFVRFTVSDPFGAADITSADVVIRNSSGAIVLSTTLNNANVVASTAGSKTYELAWTPPVGDTFTVTVTAHEGTEGVTATSQTTITATAQPDLVVVKSDGGATVNAGGSVSYTINYSNAGLANATGVVLTEFLPVGATFNAAGSTPGWVALGTGEFRFAVGNLAAGGSGSVVFSVTVPASVPAGLEQLDNLVQITDDGTHGADTNPANNASADSTPVNAAPDLVITKSDRGTSTVAGGIVLYQIRYTNVGTQNASGVVITETLPANTTFNSAFSFGEWDNEGGGLFTLTIGDLPVGASGTATFAVNVNSPLPGGVTQLFNTVSIADAGDSGPDLNPANNTATDTTPIANDPQADLQINKTNSVTSVQPGGIVTYTITITNAGPNAVTGASFTDNVPAGLTGVGYTTAVSGGATVTPVNGTGNNISGLLDLPVGATVVYTVTGTLNPNATGTLTNVATILPPAGTLDPNTGNNTAVDSDPIVPVADLSLSKSFTFTDLDGSGTLTPGDRIVFALTVTNSGPNPGYNVAVEDLLPNGYQYVSDDAAVNGGTYAIGTGIWTLGSPIGATAPNNTAVLHITAIVGPGGTYTNQAQINRSDSFDPDSTPDNDVPTEDDFASVTPPVQPKSDLSLDKIMALTSDLDSNGILSIGDRVTFTLTLNNLGPNDAANVHVADLLPAGYSFFSATASQGAYTSGTGDWNVGTVGVLSTPTLTIVATVVGGKPASAYTNYAQVSASGSFDPDSTPANGSTTEDDDASVRPTIADLSLIKTVQLVGDADDSGTLTIGDDVVFTVTVTNAGPDFATGVQVTDLLPSGYTYVTDDGGNGTQLLLLRSDTTVDPLSPGSYDPVTGLWNIGAMAPGATATLNITATVNATGNYTNTAQVTASQHFDPDSTPNNNVATEDDQSGVTLTPGAAAQPPVAVNDSSLHNPRGPVTLNVTNNDTDPNLDLNVATVDLNPGVAGRQTSLVVPGQGTWTVDDQGNVTFTPQSGFTGDPTPITYTVSDFTSPTPKVSNQATITIDYVPVATNDTSSGNTTGTAVTVPVLANDTTGDATVPSTVQIVGTTAPGASLSVPGEGIWSVNTTTGAITFTPAPGFTGDPTPIQYTVQDNDGNTSNPATVTVDYVQNPPVAVNDSSLNNPPGPVTLNVTANDTDPNNDVDPSTVDLDPARPGRQTTLVVPGEGFWQVDSLGNVTFFPDVGFTDNPTAISYTVQDKTGLVSNAATVTVTYVYPADIAITKTVSNATPNVGDTITFTIHLTNTGPGVASDVRVNDLLPAGLSFVSAATTQGSYSSISGVWLVGTLNSGDGATLILRAHVDSPDAQTNTATIVNVSPTDPNTANNTASATETPQQADLAVTKTVSNPTPNVGDQITFTVTLSNSGPNAATNVTLEDLLPTGLTFVAATPSQGTYNSTSGVWTVGTVTAGTPQTLTITATVVSPESQINTAVVIGADQFDPNTGNNQSSAAERPQQADVAILKTVSDSKPNVRDTITYTILAINTGPDTATGLTVADLLPAGVTFVSATASQGNYDNLSGIWTLGTLDFTDTATLTISATVNAPGQIENTATIAHSDQFDPNTGNNQSSTTYNTKAADLAILKTVNDPTPNVGDTITYTLTVANAGPDDATGVTVADLLPAGVTFVSATPSQGNYDNLSGSWDVGTIVSLATATLTITATVNSPVQIENTATITHSDDFDPNTGNNTDSTTTDPQAANLSITKVVSDPTPNVGDEITFTVTLTNTGPHDATGVQVTDPLPSGLVFVSADTGTGSYNGVSGIWDVGSLANGAQAVLTIRARVTSPIEQTNTATVTGSNQFDPNTGNNTASATETPQQADLSVTKTVSDATPNVGDTITFTVTLTNQGPDAATNVRMTDLLPAGLSFVDSNPSQGIYDNLTGLWTVGTVSPNTPLTLTIRATVVSQDAQTNTATVTGVDQFDPDTPDNTGSVTETPQQADLVVTKTVSDPAPNVGDIISFTVTVTNQGPDTATNVQLTDVLPPGLTPVLIRAQRGTFAGQVWDVGTLAPGDSATLTFFVRVDTPLARTNTVKVTGLDQFDPNTTNNEASATETPEQADLSLTKTVSDATPNVGDQITFTITLSNTGPDPATGVVINDLLPAGLAFVAAIPSQGTYNDVAGTWNVGVVSPTSPQTLTITATVVSPDPRTNTATVGAADQFDPDPTDNTASATETPEQADLSVTKTVSDLTPNVGDQITFTITLSNNGPDDATGVRITDLLPAGLTFVSANPSQGVYLSGTGLWIVGTVAAGTPQTLTITARVDAPDAKTNTATVTSVDQFDPNTTNNSASATETPEQANLSVTKTVSNAHPNVGDQVTFTVTLTNSGPDAATGVQLTDLLPAGLTFVSSTTTQGTYTAGNGLWDVGALANGGTAILTITATVVSSLTRTNTAIISDADQYDPDGNDNEASVSETPQRADLSVTKTVSNAHPNVGDQVTFTVTLNNGGPDAATGVQLTDLLPAGLTFVSATTTQGTYTAGNGLWDVGALANGGTAILTITATVVSSLTRTNTATVTDSDQFDPITGNNTASATETPQRADLAIDKAVSNPTPNVGEQITYTLTLINSGPDTATSVIVTDPLPTGVTFVSATASQGTYDNVTGIWTVGTVVFGATPTLAITATVNSPAEITNTATVDGDQFDPNTGNNTDSTTTDPQAAELSVTKTVSNAAPNVGDEITFTVTLINNGPNTATGVQVTDLLPAGLVFVSAATGTGSYDSGSGIWNVGSIANGAQAVLTIRARVTSPLEQTNTATVTNSDQFDPVTDNNSGSATETPQQADLSVTKTVSDPTPDVGDVIFFTVTLTDLGPDPATNVLVTDLLPSGLSFVSADPSQGVYDSTTGVWNAGTVDPTTPATLFILVRVDTPDPQTNTATISRVDQFDPNTTNNSASATETPLVADLSLTKLVSDATPNVGDVITFTVILTNNGPDTATGVQVHDLLPPGLSFVSGLRSQGTYDPATGLWNVGTVDPGTSKTLTILARVDSAETQTNTATITASDRFDPDPGNNQASATETPQQADLRLTKTVDNNRPNVGDTITFTVTLTNAGPDDATDVEVRDLLPPGLAFVSATPAQGTFAAGLWDVGTLANGATTALTIRATVVSFNTRTNTATILGADQFDPNTGNNTASATESPRQADVVVSKRVSNPTPNVGDTITFTIRVTNAGPDNATGVTLQDLLPAGLTFLSAVPTQGNYNPGTGLWAVGTVLVEGPQTLTITARVDSPDTQLNTVSVSDSDQFDPNVANNTDEAEIDPQVADLLVTKSVSDPTPNVGDTITFTVTLTNNGPHAASNVQVTDLLPAGLSFVDATPSQGTYTAGNGLWDVGTLASDGTATLAIRATVVSPLARTNTATISDIDQFDPDTTNNSDSATETPQRADLVIDKTVSDATPNVGDTITFTITLSNQGPDSATNVQVTDLLPTGLSFVDATPSQGTYTAGNGLWDVGTVSPNTPLTLAIRATVVSPNSQTNTATVTDVDQFDPNTGNNTDIATETPQQADLVIDKTVSNATPNVGDTITFTVTVTNTGPDAATGVSVTDLLPPGLTLVLATPSQGAYDSVTGLWTVGTVDAASSATLILRATVVSPLARTNTATVTDSDQFDPNTGNNTDSATETPQQADLSVTKTVSDPTPNVGDTITFTVTLTNTGPDVATSVSLLDALPAGLTFVSSIASQGSYDAASGIWTVGTVAPATPQTLLIQATVVSGDPRTNTAVVNTADQFDPDTTNNSGSATETPQRADLSVIKTVSSATPNVGDTITFTVTLTNQGPDAATGVQVTDLLPPGLSFVDATPSQGTYDNLTGIWNVGTVSPNTPLTLAIRATVVSPDARTNTATVTDSDQFDPDPADNTGSATETPQQADLSVTKSVSDPTPNVGDTITFTITLSNSGRDAATGVTVTDMLPAGVSFVSAIASQGAYDNATGIWTVGTVAVGATPTLAITATVNSPANIANTATVTDSDQFDPNTGNNTDSTTTDPQAANLSVTKTVSDDTPNIGDTITFTVTLTNTGPNTATGVQLTDLLPAGLSFVDTTLSQGSYTAGNGLWDVGALDNGGTATLAIRATVVSPDARTNTATVTDSDQFDPNAGNNTDSVTETPQRADLSVTKTVSSATPNVGDTITFTVTLTNQGPDAATGVQLTDLLPAGLSFVDATPSQGTYDDGTGLWDVGTVSPNTPLTLTIRATVVSPDAQTNTATVTDSDQFDPNTGNDTRSVTETPQQADLAVTKSVSDTTPNVGDIITFTVTLTNDGPDAATGVTIQDALPPGLSFVSATTSQGTYDSGSGAWNVGTLASSAAATLTIQARVQSPDSRTNTATIADVDQFDPNATNNTGSATETPQQADLSVTKTVSDPTPNVGDTITFTVTLTNTGPDSATSVTLTDLLPAGLVLITATPSAGTYQSTTGLWTVGTVAPNVTQTLTIQARVASPNAQTNTATITTADQFDPNATNNTGSATETPQQADLSVTKTVSDPTPNVGDTITFTITLTNTGPDAATNVRVTDLLPPGLAFVDATPSQGTYDSATGIWNAGTVNPNTPLTLAIRATVVSPDARTNTATVTGVDQFDPNKPNNTDSVTETPQQADLSVTKSVSNPRPNVGEDITFTVTLTNQGPDVATGVQVTDLLPPGLSFVSATTSQGTYDDGTGLWDVGTVSPNTPLTLTIRATVVSPNAQTNTATVTDVDQFDPDTPDNTGSATETPQQADLALTKIVSNPSPNVGETITFTITLSNQGPDAATNVRVNDLLPNGLSFLDAMTSQGTYDSATGLWTVGTVGVIAPASLTIRATVVSANGLTNTATVAASDQFDPDPTDNSASTTETPQRADLRVTKIVDDPTPNVGDTVTFAVTLSNAGPNDATNVRLTDLLPVGLNFVSATTSQGLYDNATGVWTVGNVANGASQTLAIRAVVVGSGLLTNTATISASDQFDPNTGNNQASASETPQRADLSVTKTVSDPRPNVGDTITFTITLTNNGLDGATGVQLTDLLPVGLNFVGSTQSQGTYDSASGLWDVGSLASSATAVLTIQAQVNSPAAQFNTATVTAADQFDPNPGNNSAGALEIPQQTDLEVLKAVDKPTPNVNDMVVFTITVANAGPDAATGVIVNDLLPPTLSYVSDSPSQGFYDPMSGVWTVGTVAGSATATLTIRAQVVSAGSVVNTASGTADQFDPDPNNNTDSTSVDPQVADLALLKSVSNSRPNVGEEITFTVTLFNNGPNTATGVQVTDMLPAGLAFVSAMPSQGMYVAGVWDVGTVTPGTTPTLQIIAKVVSSDPQTNTATISAADQADPDGGNNDASITEIPQRADLSLTKTVSNPRPNVNDQITFTVTLTNQGLDDATNVEINDLLPAGLAFVSASPSQGDYDNGTGIWTVGTVSPNMPLTLTIRATVVSPNAQTNTATVSKSDQFDPDTTDNSANVTETPQRADLALTKIVNNSRPNVGDLVVFTVTLKNNGPDTATGVRVNDLLPVGLSFVSATTSLGAYNSATGAWNVGSLANGDQAVLTIRARAVSPDARTNTATVTNSDQFDPNSGNNSASATETPQRADLALTKSVSDPQASIGATVAFTVTLTNNGPDAATNVQVTDLLPAGLSFVSAMTSQGNYVATSGAWMVGALAKGATATLEIDARVNDTTVQTNTAFVDRVDQFDPDNTNNQDNASVVGQTSSLSGFVFRDYAVNGVRQPTGPNPETGIAGVTITLTGTDLNGNPVTRTTQTLGDGSYVFAGLPSGTYTVTETQPPSVFTAGKNGYYDGLDLRGTVNGVPRGNSSNDQHTVTLNAGESGVEYNFGENPPADPFGFVYADLNNNGIRDGGEPGIPGVAVTVSGIAFAGTPLAHTLTAADIPGGQLTVHTNANGRWVFPIMPPGLYSFVETQPAGYIDGREQNADPNGPNTVVVGNDVFSNVELSPFLTRGPFNFGEIAPTSSLAGSVYVDTNNNAVRDPGEMAIRGATVTLTGTDITGRAVKATVVTDVNGNYRFINMFPGTYTLREAQPPNFLDGRDRAGTLGGAAGNDVISGIPVGLRQHGTLYEFGELGISDPSKFWLLSSTNMSQLFNPPGSGVTNMTGISPAAPVVAGAAPASRLVTQSPAGAMVQIVDYGSPTARLALNPYPGYAGRLAFAQADVNRDGIVDLVTATAEASSHVKVFDGRTGALLYSFLAFPGYPGGLSLATGDLNGDGYADIVVGAATGSSHVKAFDGRTGGLLLSFLAFPGYTGGIQVAAGDEDGDGRADIAVAPLHGSSHVEVFDGATGGLRRSFMAFDGFGGDVTLAFDPTTTGPALLYVATANTSSHVKAFFRGTLARSFLAYAGFNGGVRLAVGDVDGNGVNELITLAAGTDHVEVFGAAGEVDSFLAAPGPGVDLTESLLWAARQRRL